MMNRKSKGEYGYRNDFRRMRLCIVVFGVFMIVVQLLARSFTDNQSAKNILTVMAILSVLPTANLATPLLAAWRYRTPSEDFYKRVCAHKKDYAILYDLIVTTKESMIPFDAVIVHPMGIFAYCPSIKSDLLKSEKLLNEFLTAQKLDPNIKLIGDENVFFQCIDNLKPASEWMDDGSVEHAAVFLKSMSV